MAETGAAASAADGRTLSPKKARIGERLSDFAGIGYGSPGPTHDNYGGGLGSAMEDGEEDELLAGTPPPPAAPEGCPPAVWLAMNACMRHQMKQFDFKASPLTHFPYNGSAPRQIDFVVAPRNCASQWSVQENLTGFKGKTSSDHEPLALSVVVDCAETKKREWKLRNGWQPRTDDDHRNGQLRTTRPR